MNQSGSAGRFSLMSANPQNQFEPITSPRERAQVFEKLGVQENLLNAFAFESSAPEVLKGKLMPVLHRFTFSIAKIDGEMLWLQAQAPVARELKPREIVEILFGLIDGQYLLRATVARIEAAHVVFAPGGELLRLQRRRHFRARVPEHSIIKFLPAGQLPPITMTVQDLSAGGIGLIWPPLSELPAAAEGAAITGRLVLALDETIDVSGRIKTVIKREQRTLVGVEFDRLAQATEQSLIFVCLQLYRIGQKNLGGE
jgi:hypothetical protein